MRFDKFTIKSQELIQNSQTLASQYSHQQFEPEHLLAAMLKEPDGIAGGMLRKLGVSSDEIVQRVVAALEKLASVSGGGGNTASGNFSSVSGGQQGTASGNYSNVSGGYGSTASGAQSSVSGGNFRSAPGEDDWVAGSLFEDN